MDVVLYFQCKQVSAGRGMVKLTSQRARKSSPTEDAAIASSSASQLPADTSSLGRPRSSTAEPRPPPWARPIPQSDG